MRFYKYHALGNDYLVLNPADFPFWKLPSRDQIRVICHRNFGIGSDGILWGPLATRKADFALRIFNPDGSEAEKSGNGLRIFSRFVLDQGLTTGSTFTIQTLGGIVQSAIKDGGRLIAVAMGQVNFQSEKIPVAGPPREVINEKISIHGREFSFCAASIGNPHCVIPLPEISASLAKTYGPGFETNPIFPNRTNVQFLRVLDRANIQIEIWERGAGYTLASGSSSSAAAAVAHKLGLVDRAVTVHMPGGEISVDVAPGFFIQMTGPVTKIGDGLLHAELFTAKA
jgi:diaminopimelate epimerase